MYKNTHRQRALSRAVPSSCPVGLPGPSSPTDLRKKGHLSVSTSFKDTISYVCPFHAVVRVLCTRTRRVRRRRCQMDVQVEAYGLFHVVANTNGNPQFEGGYQRAYLLQKVRTLSDGGKHTKRYATKERRRAPHLGRASPRVRARHFHLKRVTESSVTAKNIYGKIHWAA